MMTDELRKEIKELVLSTDFNLEDMIDIVVEINGIIGVGLITLGDNLKEYCYSKIKKI